MAMQLHDILDGAAKFGASDIHFMEEEPPYLRVDGQLRPVQAPALTHEILAGYLKDMMPRMLEPVLEERRGVDFAYATGQQLRYRVNAYYERNHLKVVLRAISTTVPTIDELDLPPVLKRLALVRRGMILVTGATGSGKSTTLAAMINQINTTQNRCLITIEDPIEYVYSNKKSIVTQREVGVDVPSFNLGLIQALRQDPDVILIGELRSTDTVRVAITAAETGHLVYSTLHTTNAVQTIERMIMLFAEEERDLMREQIAFNLRGALSQRLMRRAGGKGRIAAMELLVSNATIEKLIYENRVRDIPGVIRGREDGMMLYDQSLADLVRAEKVDQEEAERYCDDVYAMRRYVKGVSTSGDAAGIIAGFG